MSKKFFSKKYVKITTCNLLTTSVNKCSDGNNKLIIHTANGLYLGTLKEQVDYDNLELNDKDDMLTMFRKTYLTFFEDFEQSQSSKNTVPEIEENAISIELEDVTLITSGKNIQMPFVSIFVDQIIGVSLGSADCFCQ